MSEVYVLDGFEVIDLGELFVERFPRREKLQQGWPGHGLDDQPVAFLAEQSLVAGELQVPRYAESLIATVPEQMHHSVTLHDVLPAAESTYAPA